MNFKIMGCQNELTLCDGINIVSILNQKFYNNVCFELSNSIQDKDLIMYDIKDFKKLDFDKNFEIVGNPYLLNINDKKILNSLYKDIQESIVIDTTLHSNILMKINELYNMIKNCNDDFDFDLESNENLIDLFKFLDLKIKNDSDSILNNLYKYIDIYSKFFSNLILCFFNLSDYLSDKEIEELSKYSNYHNFIILDMERRDLTNLKINQQIVYEDFSDMLVKIE
jgi:CRISPR type II-A-associated protein Csn2